MIRLNKDTVHKPRLKFKKNCRDCNKLFRPYGRGERLCLRCYNKAQNNRIKENNKRRQK